MDAKLLARIGAIVFVAAAITMTVLQLRQTPRAASGPSAAPADAGVEPDPLRAELVRCQSLGAAGASDDACLSIWAQARRRFLGPGMQAQERTPSITRSAE